MTILTTIRLRARVLTRLLSEGFVNTLILFLALLQLQKTAQVSVIDTHPTRPRFSSCAASLQVVQSYKQLWPASALPSAGARCQISRW